MAKKTRKPRPVSRTEAHRLVRRAFPELRPNDPVMFYGGPGVVGIAIDGQSIVICDRDIPRLRGLLEVAELTNKAATHVTAG